MVTEIKDAYFLLSRLKKLFLANYFTCIMWQNDILFDTSFQLGIFGLIFMGNFLVFFMALS